MDSSLATAKGSGYSSYCSILTVTLSCVIFGHFLYNKGRSRLDMSVVFTFNLNFNLGSLYHGTSFFLLNEICIFPTYTALPVTTLNREGLNVEADDLLSLRGKMLVLVHGRAKPENGAPSASTYCSAGDKG